MPPRRLSGEGGKEEGRASEAVPQAGSDGGGGGGQRKKLRVDGGSTRGIRLGGSTGNDLRDQPAALLKLRGSGGGRAGRPGPSILHPPSSILRPRLSVLGPRSSILDPPCSILDSRRAGLPPEGRDLRREGQELRAGTGGAPAPQVPREIPADVHVVVAAAAGGRGAVQWKRAVRGPRAARNRHLHGKQTKNI